jgi:hypothetical protein
MTCVVPGVLAVTLLAAGYGPILAGPRHLAQVTEASRTLQVPPGASRPAEPIAAPPAPNEQPAPAGEPSVGEIETLLRPEPISSGPPPPLETLSTTVRDWTTLMLPPPAASAPVQAAAPTELVRETQAQVSSTPRAAEPASPVPRRAQKPRTLGHPAPPKAHRTVKAAAKPAAHPAPVAHPPQTAASATETVEPSPAPGPAPATSGFTLPGLDDLFR